jgi:hypothetical protein
MFGFGKKLLEKKPALTFEDSQFGSLIFDSDLWNGKAQIGGKEICFVVDGSDAAPDRVLLEQVRRVVDQFTKIEQSAINFLCVQQPETVKKAVEPGDFTFTSLNFLWADKPDIYALEFSLKGDEAAIWRVEFEKDQPKYSGRDD